jgi:diacylglycerol kinase (ATP)
VKTLFLVNSRSGARSGSNRRRDAASLIAKTCDWDHEIAACGSIDMMGIGFDAWIADAFANAGTRGMSTYVRVGLRGFARYAAEEYEVTVDGSMTKHRAFVVAVANASQYGNNARIAPLASMQDGILDVTLIEHAPFFRLPLIAARLFAGNVHRARGVVTLRGRSITIRRPSAGAAHLDGEPVTLPDVLTIEIVPRSLRVIVPDSARMI